MKTTTRRAVDLLIERARDATTCGCNETECCDDETCEAPDAIEEARWNLAIAMADDDELVRIDDHIEPDDFAEDWLNEELRKFGVDPGTLGQRIEAFIASLRADARAAAS